MTGLQDCSPSIPLTVPPSGFPLTSKFIWVLFGSARANGAGQIRRHKPNSNQRIPLLIIGVQDKIFTAEPLRTRRGHFLLGGERLPNMNESRSPHSCHNQPHEVAVLRVSHSPPASARGSASSRACPPGAPNLDLRAPVPRDGDAEFQEMKS